MVQGGQADVQRFGGLSLVPVGCREYVLQEFPLFLAQKDLERLYAGVQGHVSTSDSAEIVGEGG